MYDIFLSVYKKPAAGRQCLPSQLCLKYAQCLKGKFCRKDDFGNSRNFSPIDHNTHMKELRVILFRFYEFAMNFKKFLDRPNRPRLLLSVSGLVTILLRRFDIILLFAFAAQLSMARNMLDKSKDFSSRD